MTYAPKSPDLVGQPASDVKLTLAGRYRLVADCLDKRKPLRCDKCLNHGQADCPLTFEVAPDYRVTDA